MLKRAYGAFGRLFPLTFYVLQYWRACQILRDRRKERDSAFQSLLAEHRNATCLQIGVKEEYGAKFGPNWTSVDLYDSREFIDFHYDIHALGFEDETFDVVVCLSILEHVPDPLRAIAELHRVLKPGGKVWVQLPFNFPYHESPKDYWRCSPDGLRVWMRDFDEILCGAYRWTRTSLVTSAFFLGRKPGAEPESRDVGCAKGS